METYLENEGEKVNECGGLMWRESACNGKGVVVRMKVGLKRTCIMEAEW